MKIFIFGNGNLSFEDFIKFYHKPLEPLIMDKKNQFIICDFKGTDSLVMELLKTKTPNVTVYHIGEKPRYLPDKYKTKVSQWQIIGGFCSDEERDLQAIKQCSHFLAKDFNSSEKRKSGTQKNIETCLSLNKINLN